MATLVKSQYLERLGRFLCQAIIRLPAENLIPWDTGGARDLCVYLEAKSFGGFKLHKKRTFQEVPGRHNTKILLAWTSPCSSSRVIYLELPGHGTPKMVSGTHTIPEPTLDRILVVCPFLDLIALHSFLF